MGKYGVCKEKNQDLVLRHSQNLEIELRRLGEDQSQQRPMVIIEKRWKIQKETGLFRDLIPKSECYWKAEATPSCFIFSPIKLFFKLLLKVNFST